MSAESDINTFRDHDGLWEKHNIQEVATPEAWAKNPAPVQRFYNERRKNILEAEPNAAHKLIAELEKCYSVQVITQNINDLHERAGAHIFYICMAIFGCLRALGQMHSTTLSFIPF